MTQSSRPQRFNAAAVAGLRNAVEPGESLRVDIDLIDPDPDQPRRVFKDEELATLAASMMIKQGDGIVGVLSPIGIKRGEGSRWRLVYGERRLRAAKAAGFRTVPVVVLPDNQTSLAVQVIENQHRSSLSNSDLTRVIMAWTDSGMSNDDIAKITNLSEHEIKYYRVLAKLPTFMAPWLDKASARALYEIHQAWKRVDSISKQAIEEQLCRVLDDELTLAEARRVIEAGRSASPTKPNYDPTIGRVPRMKAAEKIERLTIVINLLLGMINEDRIEEAKHLVATTLAQVEITPNDTGSLEPGLKMDAAA